MEKLIKGEGRTVLIVGHNIRQLQRICSRVILLDHGRITRDGNPSEVCSVFYDEAQQRNIARHATEDGEVLPQLGADIIKVTRVELLNNAGEKTFEVGMHESLTVSVNFECKKNLERPEIVVGIHTPDFVHILSVGNALPDIRPDFAPGAHEFTCKLTDVPLRPASYAVRIAFLDQYRQVIWYAENIRHLIVSSGRYDITKLPEMGLVDVLTDWEFKNEKSSLHQERTPDILEAPFPPI